MITLRPSSARGHFNHGWLDTYHTFSFGHYRDPNHMGFRSLRVINEDFVAPGQGFGAHDHADMEIITYVVKGALEHADDISGDDGGGAASVASAAPDLGGHSAVLRPGEVQRITAGRGMTHSEFNPSKSEPVHLLQIWIRPDKRGLTPGYDQRTFAPEIRRDKLCLVTAPAAAASGPARNGAPIPINQDAKLFASTLSEGKSISHALAPGRAAWIQLIKGNLSVNGAALGPGDGAAVENETDLKITARNEAEFLLFDLA